MNLKLISIICFTFFVQNFGAPITSSSSTGIESTGEKYAVLTQFMASGQRNVRWETMPNNQVDENGKAVKSKMHGSAGNFGCLDIQGREQSHGNEYTRPNGKFKYKCNDGIEEVIACISSARANKQWIKVGETLEVDGFWHKCQSYPNNSVIYTQENSCNYNGKTYHVGDEVQIGYLRMECQNDGYKVIGCYYHDSNKKVVPLERGAKKEDGKTVHYCEEKDGDLRYSAVSNGCTKNGKEYKEGEEFQQNHLRYQCEKGQVKILGCYAADDHDMKIGEDIVDEEKHMVHRCYRLGGAIEYQEYSCGVNGAAKDCKPEPIPSTPDDVPALGAGLKAPGFSSFAIVQTIDGKMASNPSSIKLDLDKIMAMGH
jgi:hypothetical protein